VKRGKTVRVAELRQDAEDLDELAGLTVVEAVEREQRTVVVGGKELTAAPQVEKLGLTRERARPLVRELSGGGRRALQPARLRGAERTVLLLDEPTNDLETDTLAAVEDLRDGWPGTLIVVSHDRYLLERVCDRQVALLGDGLLRDLPGGVEEYLGLRRAEASGRRPGDPSGGAGPVAGSAAGAAARTGGQPDEGSAAPGPTTSDAAAPSATEVRAARKELARIERRLSRIAEAEARLHE